MTSTKSTARYRTRAIATQALVTTLFTTVALVACAIVIVALLERVRPIADRLQYLEYYLDIFKTILAGFLVAMLGILIPAVVSESRYDFERMTNSRIAYSKAKTGVDYLKLHLATLKLAEASACIQEVHYQKHCAELFDELSLHIRKRYGGDMDTAQWDIMMYTKLFLARRTLEQAASQWDDLNSEERIDLLNVVLPTIYEEGDAPPISELIALARENVWPPGR